MENVLYILGAGFSAPLGLPVMSDFLEKAKDQYRLQGEDGPYGYFKEIFGDLDRIAKIQSYVESDVFNIEEVLSILTMESQLRGEDVAKRFVRFIQDVIKYYTPNFGDYLDHPPSNWHHLLYGHDDRKAMYGYFCSALLGLEFTRYEDSRNPFQIRRTEDPDVAYAVLTLNYDQVLENCANLLQTKYGYQARFTQEEQGADEGPLDWSKQTYLAKLHGCVSTGNIIPPTWNKSLHEDGLATWRLAENLIREATQIRILGYSLSDSDTYIRYLLKAGILRSEFLKSISVWCRDPDGCVKNRYDSFVRLRPPRYSFKDIDIKEALLRHYNMYRNRGENSMVFSKSLESSHGELSR